MDFLSFFEIHVKPVSVFCDCLIAAQWNQVRELIDFVTELLSAGAQVWESSVTKWALQHRMVRAGRHD
jgi:hypothetical protein